MIRQKVWNSLVNTLGKEFLAKHEITCELFTGRISLSSDAAMELSEALQEKKSDDNGEQIDDIIKAITAITEETN